MEIEPFRGFPPDAIRFYEELADNNKREWWLASKKRYEQSVRLPMEQLLEELYDEFGEGKVFRPNRDTRFAKDKAPYKEWVGAYVTTGPGGFYVQVSASGLMAAAGMHGPSRDQLAAYRKAVQRDRPGAELEAIVAALRAGKYELGGSTLKTAPRGIDPEHPRVELLRHTAIYAWREWPARKWLSSRGALDRVAETWRELRPLNDWLARHVA